MEILKCYKLFMVMLLYFIVEKTLIYKKRFESYN